MKKTSSILKATQDFKIQCLVQMQVLDSSQVPLRPIQKWHKCDSQAQTMISQLYNHILYSMPEGIASDLQLKTINATDSANLAMNASGNIILTKTYKLFSIVNKMEIA